MSVHESRREAFRGWMVAQDLTPADVARRAEIPPTTIYSYLDGKSRGLRGDTQQRIAQAFNVAVEMLFTSRSGLGREVGVWGKIGARADIGANDLESYLASLMERAEAVAGRVEDPSETQMYAEENLSLWFSSILNEARKIGQLRQS